MPFRASACLRGTYHDHAPSNLVTSTTTTPCYELSGRGGEIYMTVRGCAAPPPSALRPRHRSVTQASAPSEPSALRPRHRSVTAHQRRDCMTAHQLRDCTTATPASCTGLRAPSTSRNQTSSSGGAFVLTAVLTVPTPFNCNRRSTGLHLQFFCTSHRISILYTTFFVPCLLFVRTLP